MNSHVNRISDIHDLIKHMGAVPVVLYPGDEWQVGERRDCGQALHSYEEDMQKVLEGPGRFTVPQIQFEELMRDAAKFRQKMFNAHSPLILRLMPATKIWVKDYEKALVFSYTRGLQEKPGLCQQSCHS